jgi:rubrerythrin
MVVKKKSKEKESLPISVIHFRNGGIDVTTEQPRAPKPKVPGGHYCRCPKCRYVWRARVKHPKSCPECKTRLGWYSKRSKAVK